MLYRDVCVEGLAYTLPPVIVTSAELEQRLKPVYDQQGVSVGRLELMTGIHSRRFWEPGTRVGQISALTVQTLLRQTAFDPQKIGFLAHGSVCRDQLEPATACAVHATNSLPSNCVVFDLSNACLGLLNGMLLLANMIELGQVEAGIIVGTEDGRGLVEGTIDTLLSQPSVSRQELKLAFASLTIGCGSAAILLCHRRFSRTGHRLLGGVCRADSAAHQLCAGGVESQTFGDDRPRMQTDSEALLVAGVNLAEQTWSAAREELGWSNSSVDKAFTHQVGKAHRKLLYDRLGLDPQIDFATVDWLGNTGAAALPMTAAIGIEQGHLQPGDRVAWLGIGSGLNSIMLGLEWGRGLEKPD